MKSYNVAIVGATGAVGQELLKILRERNFPIGELRLLATERSAGKIISFKEKEYVVALTTPDSFADMDIVLFAGGSASTVFAKDAVKAGAVVIDNSSSFRMDPNVPLVVPEVNPEDVKLHKGIIANPNCSTIQMVVALKPLHDYAKINRIVVSTYQAVSGAGKEGINELNEQVKNHIDEIDIVPEVFSHQIAFNVIPHIDVFLDNGYTKEEMKMVNETKKIMGDDSIKATATTVRIPVMGGHSESVNVEFEQDYSMEDIRKLLSEATGILLVDDVKNLKYPMPMDAHGKDEVLVGRLRRDESNANTLNMWIVADNLRKGAATNAVQIAEYLRENKLV